MQLNIYIIIVNKDLTIVYIIVNKIIGGVL